MADKDMLAAVSGAIDTADTLPVPAKQEPVTDADADVEAADADTTGGEAEVAEGAAGGEAADTSGDTEGEGADPKAGKGTEGAEGTAAGKDGKAGTEGTTPEATPKPPAKSLDPVNDPIPPTVSERTRERITSLIGTVKQQTAQLEQANTLFDAVADTGMQPEELAQMLGYAHARHKGTPEQREAAYTFLQSELKALALELGKVDAVDFLAEHPDLQEAVTANQMTEAHAKEMAMHRARVKHQTATTEATNVANTTQAAHAAGTQALNTLGRTLAARDGATFVAKHKIIMATLGPQRDVTGRVTNPGVLARFPPDQWAQVYQNAYSQLAAPAAAVPPIPAVPPKVAPQPLRPGTPAGGGGKREAKSMADAVSAAIDGIND